MTGKDRISTVSSKLDELTDYSRYTHASDDGNKMFSRDAPYNAIDDTDLIDCETETVICKKNGNQNIREHSVKSFSVHASDFDQDED